MADVRNSGAASPERDFFELTGLSVGYNGKALIHDIDLKIKKGEIVTLIGPNGAGKSTILKTITRQLAKIVGTVTFDGKEYSSKQFCEYIKNLKETEMKNIEQEKEETKERLNEEYEGGSIVGPLYANCNYRLQMEWALKLVDIYNDI